MKIIKCGNPTDPEVTVGPLIDENHYMRTHARINNAKQFGAEVFSPSNSKTGIMPPHLTLGLNYNHDLVNKEVFGPVLNILTYDNFDQGMDIFNKLGSSLQGSIYTNNIQKLFSAYNRLKTAALIHNFPPAFRVDQMPYGGILESGFGREGIAYVVEEFSEKKLLVINEVMV